VALYYLANLTAGLLVALPLFLLLRKFAGHSLAGAELATRIDLDFLVEFGSEYHDAISSLGALFLVVAAAYWLVGLFLSGGALTVFVLGVRSTPVLFWGSAARYFGRFIRLFIISLPVLVALVAGLPLIENAVSRLLFGADPYQPVLFWGRLVRVGLRQMGILLFVIVFDYARIHSVASDERSMLRALAQGIAFAFQNIRKTFVLTASLAVFGAFVLAAYNVLSSVLSSPLPVAIAALVLLQQAYILFRMILRLSLYSSEVALYMSLREDRDLK
jgi:hypothetical protein